MFFPWLTLLVKFINGSEIPIPNSLRFHGGLLGFRVESARQCKNLAKRLSARQLVQGHAHEGEFCFLASKRIKYAGKLKFHLFNTDSDYR